MGLGGLSFVALFSCTLGVPELDTVTPGALSTVVEEFEPASTGFGDDPSPSDPVLAAVVDTALGPWADTELVAPSSGVAHAMPAGVATADPTPSATASAPIRPT